MADSQQVKDQVKDAAQEVTSQVQDKAADIKTQVQDKAQEIRGQAGDKVRGEVDQRSTQIGQQVSTFASAIRTAGQQLREDGNDAGARVVDQAAERAEVLGAYLTNTDGQTLMRDVESFARRQPWVVAVAGVAAGFVVGRLIKASGTDDESEPAAASLPSYDGSPTVASAPSIPAAPTAPVLLPEEEALPPYGTPQAEAS